MSETPQSPLLQLPGAVAGDGIDAPVAAHYGSFNTEQRRLAAGEGFVDLSHRDVIRIAGPERLSWLHNLTTQHFLDLPAGRWVTALVLSPQGHVEHAFTGVDDGEAFIAHTEPGAGEALLGFLTRMVFMTRVEVTDATPELAVTWRATGAGEGRHEFVRRDQLATYAAAAEPAAGMWAFEALRIERGEPRLGIDTDHRTIPNEVGWVPASSLPGELGEAAVHLEKGCYRGQETVARVHTLGRPPRRLVLLHLDGSENRLPARGAAVLVGEKEVGFVGSSARHHELGPIALALVKRNVPVDAALSVDGMPASQEVIVDPEIGLHVRPNLR
ncbi:folate-binding protein [Nocardioides phosphati]|uniref:Folate-binding protein n=1 Tax=Nocardioides phosphati TaxID=1867775 RepID=A0ABQ2NES5_9ACTN|nr:folate-binding protein YgfZ [Nocardioides phosphati]GGO93537.1 folate-binding protein [Nocardioides phosphati]